MDFSLILPTRKRVKKLSRLLDSIKKTTKYLNRLEIILFVDEDDPESQKITDRDLVINIIVGQRGLTMGRITRTCYQASRGRWIMLLNDDVIFRTRNWDVSVRLAFNKYDDEILLVYGNDLFQREKMASFPIFTRTVAEILGKICPSEYERVFIDLHIFDVFKKLQSLGEDRILYLPDLVFEHRSFDAGKAPSDESYTRRNITYDQQMLIMANERRQIAALKIFKHIRERSSNAAL